MYEPLTIKLEVVEVAESKPSVATDAASSTSFDSSSASTSGTTSPSSSLTAFSPELGPKSPSTLPHCQEAAPDCQVAIPYCPITRTKTENHDEEEDCPPAKRRKVPVDEMLMSLKSMEPTAQFELWRRMLSTHPFDLEQLKTLRTTIDDRIKVDIISGVPYEIAAYIMSFLSPKDLCQAGQTCRSWRIVCEDNRLWREKCAEEGLLEDKQILSVLMEKRIAKRNKIQEKFAFDYTSANVPKSQWKAAYLQHIDILRNWHRRSFEIKKPLASGPRRQPQQRSGQEQARAQPDIQVDMVDEPGIYMPRAELEERLERAVNGHPPQQPLGNPGQVQLLQRLRPRHQRQARSRPLPPQLNEALVRPINQQRPSVVISVKLPGVADPSAAHGEQAPQVAPANQPQPLQEQQDQQAREGQPASRDDEQHQRSRPSLEAIKSELQPGDQESEEPLSPSDSDTGHAEGRKDLMLLRCHEESVITCLQYNPQTNIIVSGSDDQTLKVWCSDTGRCLSTLEGHTGGVWASQLSPDDTVISGSTDRTLRVWRARTGKLVHTLYGHGSTVRCLALCGDKVASGSRDTTLRLWDINLGTCLNVFQGHSAAVRCVEFKGDRIVSGAYDFLVMVWDTTTGLCLHALECHENRIYSLQYDGRTIASGSLDSTICVWDAETGKLRHRLEGHISLTSKMQLKDNMLVSANADSYCKLWDVYTGECLRTLDGPHKHTSAVTSVYFDNRHVVTSSDDGTVKLWDIKTGEFIRNLIVLPTADRGGVVWRIRASYTKLICAVGSRATTPTYDTHLLVLDFK